VFLAGEALGRLYINKGKSGPGRFRDETAKWGVPEDLADSHGTLLFDLEGDGDLDLLVLRSEHNSMILRHDAGKFVDATDALGFRTHRGAHVASVFDADRDGDLDIYLGYYGSHAANVGDGRERSLPSLDGKNGSPNQLWRQEPDGRFTEVGEQAGCADPGWALAVMAFDADMDGDLDLHIANDFGPDTMLRNAGDGTFADVTAETGTGDRGSGMNVDVTDFNGDGFWDVYVSNIDMFSKRIKVIFPRDESTINIDESLTRAFQYLSGNKFYVNPGAAGGAWRAEEALRFEPGDRGWGWDVSFFDYENDGDEDMYLTNGWINGSYAGNQPNQMFLLDDAYYYRATDPATDRHPAPEEFPANSRSVGVADFDRDGDVDLLVNNFRQPPVLMMNAQRSGNRWLGLRLTDGGRNPYAIGALVTIEGDGKRLMRHVTAGRGYLGQADTVLMAGVGKARSATVTVRWTDGTVQKLDGLATNRVHAIARAAK
jgi:hypothetical protein